MTLVARFLLWKQRFSNIEFEIPQVLLPEKHSQPMRNLISPYIHLNGALQFQPPAANLKAEMICVQEGRLDTRVAPSQLGGHSNWVLQPTSMAAAFQHNATSLTAWAEAAAPFVQPGFTEQPTQKHKVLPCFSTLDSVETFFRQWEEGDSFTGKSGIKDIPASQRRGEGKRFYEWKKAGEALERRAKARNLSHAVAAAQAEAERRACHMPVAKFLKEVLGKE